MKSVHHQPGMGVQVKSEWAFIFVRNQCSSWIGMGVQDGSEYARIMRI